MDEDTTLLVPFGVWDLETPAEQLRVVAQISDRLGPFASEVLTVMGVGTNRRIFLQP